MTKSLTEKWKDGELHSGFYYIQDYTGKCVYRHLTGRKPDADFIKCFKEVLAPVPSYEEDKKLQEQLKEANDCINSAQISLRGYMLKINEYKKKWGVK